MNYLFTGIVAGMGEVVSFNNNTLSISIPEMSAVEQGASIALDGVCLTVVGFSEEQVWFDIVDETLNVTTLGALQIGDKVEYVETSDEYVHQPIIQTVVDELLGKGKCPSNGENALRAMYVQDCYLSEYYS